MSGDFRKREHNLTVIFNGTVILEVKPTWKFLPKIISYNLCLPYLFQLEGKFSMTFSDCHVIVMRIVSYIHMTTYMIVGITSNMYVCETIGKGGARGAQEGR